MSAIAGLLLFTGACCVFVAVVRTERRARRAQARSMTLRAGRQPTSAHSPSRASLCRTRANRLDDATGALPDRDGDDTMASPALLGLLLHAVAAKRHLTDLEAAAGTRDV
jgi:hypothetical protein